MYVKMTHRLTVLNVLCDSHTTSDGGGRGAGGVDTKMEEKTVVGCLPCYYTVGSSGSHGDLSPGWTLNPKAALATASMVMKVV